MIIGRDYYGDNQVVSYTDTWFIHHLRTFKKDNFVLDKCNKIIKPLSDYDFLRCLI